MARPELGVVVVGAGPAGAVAARRLAELGADPLLLEKAEVLPRGRACAGILTAGARRRLAEVGLASALGAGRDLASATITVPGAFHTSVELPEGAIRIVSRARLDHELVLAAEQAGARVETGRLLEELEAEPGGGWRLRVGRDTLHARHVILATGLRDPITAMLDPGASPGGMGLALELEVPRDRAQIAGLHVEIGAHPGGWFWLCPLGRRCTAGLVSSRARVPGARRLLNLFLDRHGLAASGVLSSATDLIPGATARPRPVRPGLVPVGDVLPAVDPLTGLGLEGALRSGVQAAELVGRALLDDGPEPAAAMEAWRRGGTREARAAARVGEALHRRPVRFLEALEVRRELGAELGACVLGQRSYAGLFGRLWPTPFERMVRSIERGR